MEDDQKQNFSFNSDSAIALQMMMPWDRRSIV
jgi:hypothetical protein